MAADEDALIEQARAWVGAPAGEDKVGRDPVNRPMIHHWVQALGDDNPIYVDDELASRTRHGGLVAPPGMLQTWTMDAPQRDPEGPQAQVMALLDAAGYTSVVATDYEHEYRRELRPGDHITQRSTVEDLGDEKRTALGTGRFITVAHTYVDQDGGVVGVGRMRMLKFRPPESDGQGESAASGSSDREAERRDHGDGGGAEAKGADAGRRPRPAINRDNAYFWEGVEAGELRIQRCAACGTLRHPPRPMCAVCRSTAVDHVVAGGRGWIHSYVVHHHPPLPGVSTPHPVLLVDLEEGVRILSEATEETAPEELAIGSDVELAFERVDDELTVPAFRLSDPRA